jgi:3-oxoacid CoA-transferase
MAATRRSCTRLSAILPSSSNALFRTQLPRASARIALNNKRAGVAATLTFTRGFINDVKTSSNSNNEVDDIELNESLAPTIDRSRSKVYASADEAVADIKSGSTILSAGFGLCGTAGMCFPL